MSPKHNRPNQQQQRNTENGRPTNDNRKQIESSGPSSQPGTRKWFYGGFS